MTDEQTCGQGLAQHAELPQLTGELLRAVAENLRRCDASRTPSGRRALVARAGGGCVIAM